MFQKQALSEAPQENYDSENETEIYQAFEYAKEHLDQVLKVFTATLLPETVIPEETNIEKISKNPGEEIRGNIRPKRQTFRSKQQK